MIQQGSRMELTSIFILLYVVVCLFMVANWLNRRR